MGLRAALEMTLSDDAPLSKLDDFVWQSLAAAASSKRHPWNWGIVSSVDAQGRPQGRTVILRDAIAESCTIDFHTDVRSAKTDQLDNGISWVFYAENQQVQLRVRGRADIIGGAEADQVWQKVPVRSRSAYVSRMAPGIPFEGDQPPPTDDRQVTEETSERGREYFRIIRTHVTQMDLLYLRREGHVRAQLDFEPPAGSKPRQSAANWILP